MANTHELPFDPTKLERELRPFYLGPNEKEISEMLSAIDLNQLDELFKHIPDDIHFDGFKTQKPVPYNQLADYFRSIANKNVNNLSFLGDGLQDYTIPRVVPEICNIRGLTTAYTPYQPERSQGTLITLWIYSSCLAKITGMEAINASLYERSTCLYEALLCSTRLKRGKNKVLVFEGIYPGDLEVLNTLNVETDLEIETLSLDPSSGTTSLSALKEKLDQWDGELAAVAFPQVNSLGNIEDFDNITRTVKERGLAAIGIIDPMLFFKGGLKKPSEWGDDGVDMIVGEGQHLCLGPNFGGPGLGIFGIRFNDNNKNAIRSTAGRFVGRAVDEKGKDCFCMVLSTREQHIRREKATSNICSNQSFVATIAGASILSRGEAGHTEAIETARTRALSFAQNIQSFKGIELAYPQTPFFNELTLKSAKPVSELISKASQKGINIGVNVSSRVGEKDNLLLVSFSDKHSAEDVFTLLDFLKSEFSVSENLNPMSTDIPLAWQQTEEVGLPFYSDHEIISYYQKLGDLNASPDDNIYPLGSCTMKYNPYINDYTASLEGFTQIHPQAPEENAQGCLEVLYQIQEEFKQITGLPGVTTQPVAGAQGELVGLKMFQAYHRDRNQNRDILLIPKSAHGTNPATATMAGYKTSGRGEQATGIVTIEAFDDGLMNIDQIKQAIGLYGNRIAGIMVTNPNTSGIFETRFKEMAKLIHDIGGLVYMDGANMNAISGWIDLDKMGVDAVHNNLHKTWTIPHGGGGPGDAIVAVSDKLVDYLPGIQVLKEGDRFKTIKPSKSIGSFHRHFGNFAHKVRCLTYLRALGTEGIKMMSAVAVLSARYLYSNLRETYPTLPTNDNENKMHEFIITLSQDSFKRIEDAGIPKAQIIAKIGKLFLDFGIHAPTVAFPEQFGLMIEPTESFDKGELDRFSEVVKSIYQLIHDSPQVLKTAPHFTPVAKVDEVSANKNLIFCDPKLELPVLHPNKKEVSEFKELPIGEICKEILGSHQA